MTEKSITSHRHKPGDYTKNIQVAVIGVSPVNISNNSDIRRAI